MNPFYRFPLFKSPVDMISWNALLGCDAYDKLVANPAEAERAHDIRSHHISRMLAGGITDSVLDPMSRRAPYYCYLGFALGEFGIPPLGGRGGARWYAVKNVREHWERTPQASALSLERTKARIEQRYGVALKGPSRVSLP